MHDVGQFLYLKALVMLWFSTQILPPPHSHTPAKYKHMREILFVLALFSIPSGLHLDAAVKILTV
jgi:hypothetical protein